MTRKNLRIETRAHAHRVVFENSTADSVVFEKLGVLHQTRARREVIIAAGAIGSPQLLMLSGLGDPEQLKQHHIPVVKQSPGVGKNLQDHLQIRSVYKINQPLSLNDELRNPLKRLGMGLEYLFRRRGPLTMAASQVAAFASTQEGEHRPDIQFHFQPLSSDKPAEGTHAFSAFTASVCQLRPSSRGQIRLNSANPKDHPQIVANYLDTELDQSTAIAGLKKTREICSSEPIASLIEEEFEPGIETQSDEEILEFARARGTTIYHPAGTCRMGPACDPMNVVDHRLRVHGVERLRVVDCSIMPTLTSGNTNAPAIMIAEKAAEMILQDLRSPS